MHLFIKRSQRTSKWGKNKKVLHEHQASVPLKLSAHFEVFCDLLLIRCTATWILLVLNNKETKIVYDTIYTSVLKRSRVRSNQNVTGIQNRTFKTADKLNSSYLFQFTIPTVSLDSQVPALLFTYYFLTKSEVITVKSQTKALMYWPSNSEVNTSRPMSEISL